MPTSSVGAINKERGVTLLELLIVMTLIALVAGLSFPSVSSGLDSLRLRTASDSIVSFLNTAIDRAERRQQVIEVVISPGENTLTARSPDREFSRRLDVPEPIKIIAVQLGLEGGTDTQGQPRRFLLYPGGAAPRIGIEIANPQGRKRMVRVDPITGAPSAEAEAR